MAKWTSPVLGALSAALATGLAVSLITGGPASGAGPGGDTPPPQEEQLRAEQQLQPMATITPDPELLYVPVTPCRIVDTRLSGARFGNGTTRSFHVAGTQMFVPQGGKSGGCGIPVSAQAVTATVTAVSPTRSGFLRAWAAGGPEPTATLLNYATTNTGTGTTVPIRSGGTTALTVKNHNGSTDLVIDVTGYYAPQLQAYVAINGTVIHHTSRFVSATKTGTGTYTVTWDRNVAGCAAQATSDVDGMIVSVLNQGAASFVKVRTDAGLPTDYWFHLLVTC